MTLWKVGKKEVKVPLIQGGMGVGISLGRLAGTVAKHGGVGIISTAQIGFREPDFDRNTAGANIRVIGKELKKARQISPDGIIGFNIMVALREYEQHVKEAVKCGADLIISGAGLPVDLPKMTAGSRTAIAPIVSTEKSAQVILKYWDKKYQRTASLVARKMGITAGALTTAMNALVKKHYVVRNRSEVDRRVVYISLTEKGRKAYAHHQKFHMQMADAAIAELTEEEVQILAKTLSHLSTFFRSYGDVHS